MWIFAEKPFLPVITLAATADLFQTPVIEIESGAQSWITGSTVGSYSTVANGTVGSVQTCDMVLTTGIIYSLSNHYTHKAN